MIPELETGRLTMRGWREADFFGFAAIRTDERQARDISGAVSRVEAWRRLAAIIGHWTLRGYGFWALEARATGNFVGYAGLCNPEGWPEQKVGWALVRQALGRGYATEAAERARAYAYAGLGWATAISYIAFQNKPSIRVAERLGARLESTSSYRDAAFGVFRHPPASEFRFAG
jgi:RimJ/RimL family protein N-acetyltransferase